MQPVAHVGLGPRQRITIALISDHWDWLVKMVFMDFNRVVQSAVEGITREPSKEKRLGETKIPIPAQIEKNLDTGRSTNSAVICHDFGRAQNDN